MIIQDNIFLEGLTHAIHVWYIHLQNVGKYTSPMDPLGYKSEMFSAVFGANWRRIRYGWLFSQISKFYVTNNRWVIYGKMNKW